MRPPSARAKSLTSGMLALTVAACVFVPRASSVYRPECQIHERHLTLEAYQVATLVGCRDEGCVTALVFIGAVSVASAVVSGSVVVVGNAVTWLERQGRCQSIQAGAHPRQ